MFQLNAGVNLKLIYKKKKPDACTIAHAEAAKNNLRAYSQCECWRKTELTGG